MRVSEVSSTITPLREREGFGHFDYRGASARMGPQIIFQIPALLVHEQ
ncbi:MAG: hypothetical protein ABI939_12325 [Anaerolineaceae bacterium]